ncbi:hypothetical protein ACHAXA_007093, partial [Cyclostephanos tholiformis]
SVKKMNDADKNNNNKFVPPKLSFSASDYYASLREDNIVKSLQTEDESGEELRNTNKNNEEEEEEAPWKIFQATTDPTSVESIRRRSGPLLTLFPSGNGGMNSHRMARHVILDPVGQRAYLVAHSKDCNPENPDALLDRYDLLAKSSNGESSHLAVELWKYCALYAEGGVYVDPETSPLATLGDALGWDVVDDNDGRSEKNWNYVATSATRDSGVSPSLLPISSIGGDGNVVNSTISDSVNIASSRGTGDPVAISSFVAISSAKHDVPRRMIDTLLATDVGKLVTDALLLPRSLMTYARECDDGAGGKRGGTTTGGGRWGYLRQRCSGIEIAPPTTTTLRHCPESAGYCCEILDPTSTFVLLLSRHSLVPNQVLPIESALPAPYRVDADPSSSTTSTGSAAVGGSELAFLATVHEVSESPLISSTVKGNSESTPNVYEILSGQGALPNQVPNRQACMDCLREKKASDCRICGEKCGQFCNKICEVEVKEKPVKRVVSVSAPKYRKDPERFIPRIVHQTWFEPVTPEKYPNMSRLIESWKRSGWEYHFWDDESAAEFLALHFPPEVREAYDSILPGAFKADLFRYCVLLIMGGIYSDMDVMLESNLDAAVPPDVGFMVPVDAPGIRPDKRMCLWNGMIASAPAHPFLVRAIEHVVNNIRNRFTVVDYDRMMCPMPETSVVHAFSTLFTAGPCILGLTVNEVMGRGLQQTFVEGDLVVPDGITTRGVPGRTIILRQNKWDMGAHRFTWDENNLVIAATDMPDYDDRKELEGESKEQATHYSKTLDRNSLYGEGKVYVDRNIAHERIVMIIQGEASSTS